MLITLHTLLGLDERMICYNGGMKQPTLAVCASASFYPKVIAESDDIEKYGINLILPMTAAKMKADGSENNEAIIDWSKSPSGYHSKALHIREHFKVIEKSDGILVMNYEKHGMKDYIGPNVLMEMSTAFYLDKPIYILNGIPQDSPLIDEILGLEPIFLYGDLAQIRN